jgi:Cys-tRNA(Pro)/Cys-tRNA(Cys) deacylase
MAAAPDAQRMTGYVVGGISPFGQKRRLATVVDETVRNHATVFVSAGRRGWDVELDPDALVAVTAAVVADIAL